MTQFHEGQEVEVFKIITLPAYGRRKAKIVLAMRNKDDPENDRYEVQFPDGTSDVFDKAHIRAVKTTTTILDSGPLTVKVTHIP